MIEEALWVGVIYPFDSCLHKDQEPFDLGNGVHLDSLPAQLRDIELLSLLSDQHREEVTRFAIHALTLNPFEHALTAHDTPKDRLLQANFSLWLAKPSSTSIGLIIILQRETHRGWYIAYTAPPRLWRPVDDVILRPDDLTRANTLNTALAAVKGTAIWSSTRAAWRALTESWSDLRFVLFWVALEALFGPNDGGPITNRLCRSVARFLAADEPGEARLFDELVAAYGVRCRFVHGLQEMPLLPGDVSPQVRHMEAVCNAAIRKAATSHAANFSDEATRHMFLESLPHRPLPI